MPEIEQSGYRAWWPVKQFTGKGPDRKPRGIEVFRNMVTGAIYAPVNGWNGEPPYPTGDTGCVKTASAVYRDNYEKIFSVKGEA